VPSRRVPEQERSEPLLGVHLSASLADGDDDPVLGVLLWDCQLLENATPCGRRAVDRQVEDSDV
jgi:hypothetical protein